MSFDTQEVLYKIYSVWDVGGLGRGEAFETSGTSRFAENHLILWVLTGPSAHLGTQAYNRCMAQKFLFPRFKQTLQGLVSLQAVPKPLCTGNPPKAESSQHHHGDGGWQIVNMCGFQSMK